MARQKTKAKTKALRGNERIQQLMEAFPEIPRSLVIKEDAMREGTRPNATSHQVGRWALPEAPWYFEYDKEDTHTAAESVDGYILSPLVCSLPNGVSWHILWDSRSPYEFRYEERGRYRLYRDGEPIEEVFFPPRPQWYSLKTSSGKPMASVIVQRGEGALCTGALTYCEYFKDDLGCRYCNINPAESVKEALGLERQKAKREQDLYETVLAAAQEGQARSMFLSGGVILDPSKEADNYARIAKVITQAAKDSGIQQFPFTVKSQAMEPDEAMKLKEAGVTALGFNMEVWDPRLFDIMCPGKAKYVGREGWIQRLLKLRDVFGAGAVTSFVVGLEMAPPYGFKDEDEAAASYLEGYEWMLAHGIGPGGALWRPAPGTEFSGQAPPRTEYFLRMDLARHRLNVKYNKVPKPGKPSGYGLDIRSDFPHVGLLEASAAGSSGKAAPSAEVC